jgi:hypothetical protein
MTPGTRGELTIGDRTDSGAHEAVDGMSDRFAHAAHLTIAPLVDDDP